MSWGDFINGPERDPGSLVRSDWGDLEKAFRDNIKSFVDSIEVANPLVPEYSVSQGKPHGEVVKETEEKSVKKQDEQGAFVESSPRAEAPARPAEPAKAEPAEQAVPEVPRPAEQAVPERANVPNDDWMSPPKKPKEKAVPPPPSAPSSHDFDASGFNAEMNKMQDVIDQVRSFDLSHYVAQISTFGVHVDLDSHRENPEVIASAFTKLYGAYTTAHARLMELLPMRHRIDSVVDYLMDVGMAFSQASNKERRTGQVKLALGDLLRVQEEVQEVCESYERTCKHLLAQHDMVSRLFSWHQNYLIPRGIGVRLPSSEDLDAPSPSKPNVAPRPRVNDDPPRDFPDKAFSGLDEMPEKPSLKDQQPGFVNFSF